LLKHIKPRASGQKTYYDDCIKTMFGSSIPPVVCMRVHVLITLFVFVCVHSGVQHMLCCVFVCFTSSCVPYVASFSGLSIFGIL